MKPLAVRVKDAPALLGMDRATFDREIRPHLNLIRITAQGRGFDYDELEVAWDEYKARNVIEPAKPWNEPCPSTHPVSTSATESGTSTKRLGAFPDFEAAAERATSRKRSAG